MYKSCMLLTVRCIYRFLANVLFNLITFFISSPFTVLLIFLLIAHLIFKRIILFIRGGDKTSIFYGAGRKMVGNGDDWGWVELRQENIMQAVLVFDSTLNVNRIRELVSNRVIPIYPRLKQKICPLPYTANTVYCWLPDKLFDINKHVYVDHTLITSQRQLQNYMSKHMFEKLSLDKPPWELRILTCQDGSPFSDTIIVLRVHQSLADAMTLIKILCTRLSDTRTSYTAIKDHYKVRYYLRIVQACCIGPALILYRLLISSFSKFWFKLDKMRNCSIHWSSNISLYKLERIKQVTRTSYNCVMLSAVSGAFRQLLQNTGIKHPPNLKIVLPVTIDKDQRYLPVVFDMPVSMEGAIPRLWKVKYDLRLLFKSYDPFFTFFIFYILMPICPSKFRAVLNNISKKSANIQFSSITGPTSRLVIDGSPLKTIYTFLPSKNHLGVAISVITYADQVSVSIVTNCCLGNTGKFLVKYIEEQVEQMFVLLMNRTIPDEVNNDYNLNYLPDISQVTSRELKSRMQVIQYEMQQLNEVDSTTEDDARHFNRLKCEYQHALKEMKRRKSEKRKRGKCSNFIQSMVKVQTMCSLKGRKIVLYSLPQQFAFDTEESSSVSCEQQQSSNIVECSWSDNTNNDKRSDNNNNYDNNSNNNNNNNNNISSSSSSSNNYSNSNDEINRCPSIELDIGQAGRSYRVDIGYLNEMAAAVEKKSHYYVTRLHKSNLNIANGSGELAINQLFTFTELVQSDEHII